MMFTDRLRALREDADIKQKDIAAALHIKPNTYNRYECGVNEPDIAMLLKMADFFGVSMDFLLDHAPKKVTDTPELANFLRSGDYLLGNRQPTVDERNKLAKFIELFFPS